MSHNSIKSNCLRLFTLATASLTLLTTAATPASGAAKETGFVSVFDGQTLNGWKLVSQHGDGYGVKDGVIYCARGGGGNLFTEKEYADFILRFEFKLEAGSNNGIGIRAPYEGDAAYMGMEIQVLDDTAEKYANLQPYQYHGSVYGVTAAKRGALKPVGEWNVEEISAIGRHIKVILNGKVITEADLNSVTDAKTIQTHPGMLRERGHIGFLGHGDYVEFRNLRVKEITAKEKDNTPPAGFTALFNGQDLAGWKGLLAGPNDNPIKRAALAEAERAELQKSADNDMRAHWRVDKGEIAFDGKGRSLATQKDYGDFEMYVDWKITPHGDSGIYLRGNPQVQIWDPGNKGPNPNGQGSGGLYNNQKNPSGPLKVADKPIGEWNRFRIVMAGEKAHVFLNGEMVVNNVTLENFWDRSQPIFPTGQIELQNHGDQLWFKNIYIRELTGK